MNLYSIFFVKTAACIVVILTAAFAQAATSEKPNIIVIWGDDIGQSNISAYSHGVMGYQTPHIDRVAKDGMMFTDYYAEQSCTAGRAAFIMGQSVYRSGLSKVGLPGAALGMRAEDPTIAELLKPLGYATGKFGKNHLGDRDKHLPTNHGFDEFYGNLYHLNAEEEPEHPDYPTAADFPDFKKNYGPRGVIHSWAQADGTQKIEDTGPLTKKRMETIDNDTADRAAKFIEKQHEAGKPVFAWINFTHMHFRTYIEEKDHGRAGRWQSVYHDAMIHHDKNVGTILDKLDEIGIAENTIVFYSTENGPHRNTWPDAGMTTFRSEKNTNWKVIFARQDVPGTMLTWSEPLIKTRLPWLINLRTDPYEFAPTTSNTYWDWWLEHAFLLIPAQQKVADFMKTFVEYPPQQKAASFTVDQIIEQLTPPSG